METLLLSHPFIMALQAMNQRLTVSFISGISGMEQETFLDRLQALLCQMALSAAPTLPGFRLSILRNFLTRSGTNLHIYAPIS